MKKIFNYTLALCASMFVAGCDDFLDKEPLDQRVDTNFFKTESDAMEALVSVYDALQWNSLQGFHPSDMFLDVASDDAFAGGASSSDVPNIQQIDNHAILTTNNEVQGLYRKYFIGIQRANALLEKIDSVDASKEFKAQVTAESKFLRAYFYLDLVRFYENVPLITKTLVVSESFQPQAKPADIYNQIARDLWEAKDGLPATISRDGRVTKWAAEALLARAYLFYNGVYKGDLTAGTKTIDRAAALALLEDVIQNSGHRLLDNFADNFTKANEFSDESLFEISYSDLRSWGDWGYIQGGEGNIGIQMRGPRLDEVGKEIYETGWSMSTVSQSLVDAFSDSDPRKTATLLSQTEFKGKFTVGYQHTGYYNKKYTTSKDYKPTLGGAQELNWGNNYRVIRYSDVLLMAAELQVLLGNAGTAKGYLDQVRDRVDMPLVAATLDNIYQERRLEFALEGIRYWDLLRRGLDVAATAINSQNVRGPLYQGDQITFNITFNQARKGFFPIPQNELDIQDGKMNQNDGY